MSRTLTANECIDVLREHDNFLVLTHHGPDGDAVGSASALCILLRELGKTAYALENPDLTEQLSPFIVDFHAPDGFTPDFVVAVDIADPKLLPSNASGYADKCGLCIDHHSSNNSYAAATWLDSGAAACAELIYDLAKLAGIEFTPLLAERIYLGLVTDTGCFRYPSVTPRTMRAGADCIATGIDFYSINREFIEVRSRKRLEIEKAALENCEYYGNGSFALAWLDNSTLEKYGATDEDSSNIATYLRCIEGVVLSIFLREKEPGKWRISARSDPAVDSSAILSRLGGGGHRCAAGAEAHSALDELLAAVKSAAADEAGLQ